MPLMGQDRSSTGGADSDGTSSHTVGDDGGEAMSVMKEVIMSLPSDEAHY